MFRPECTVPQAKYALTDVEVAVVSNEWGTEKVRLSAAASPMGFTLGRLGLELTAEDCRSPHRELSDGSSAAGADGRSDRVRISGTPNAEVEGGAPAHIGL